RCGLGRALVGDRRGLGTAHERRGRALRLPLRSVGLLGVLFRLTQRIGPGGRGRQRLLRNRFLFLGRLLRHLAVRFAPPLAPVGRLRRFDGGLDRRLGGDLGRRGGLWRRRGRRLLLVLLRDLILVLVLVVLLLRLGDGVLLRRLDLGDRFLGVRAAL